MKLKKVLALTLAIAMVLASMGTVAFADEAAVATVNGTPYTSLQDAIVAAAPNGTVEIVDDIVVDEWIMFAESLNIGTGQIITQVIDGLTINGDNHTLTIKSIESASNGNNLFFDARNLNIKDLTIEYTDAAANQGGIGLKSGTIKNVNFVGGGYAIFPGAGDITIEGCDFATNSTSIYFEEARDNLVVTGCKFENADNVNVILLRGDVEFTNNIVISGRTINIVSGSPVVTGNDFGDVRFKVYNEATATVENNEINVLAFNDNTIVKSTFGENTLSDDAQDVFDAAPVAVAKVGDDYYETLQDAINAVESGEAIDLLGNVAVSGTVEFPAGITLNGNGKDINLAKSAVLSFNDGSVLNGVSVKDGGTSASAASVKYYGTINFHGTNNMIPTDTGTVGGPFHLIVNEDATLLINRFTLGYDRAITVNGTIQDAHTFDPTGQTPSLKFNSTSGVSIGGNKTGNLTVENAYVELNSSSWKNATGTYDWSFTNSYVSATSFTNNNPPGNANAAWDVTFDNSVVATNYIKSGKNVTYSLTNGTVAKTNSIRIDGILNIDETSSLTVAAQQNNKADVQDEHGDISGTINVEGTLEIDGASNQKFEVLGGTINVDGGSMTTGKMGLNLTAGSALNVSTDSSVTSNDVVGTGAINIDVSNYNGYSDLSNIINADLSEFTGEVGAIGGDSATVRFENGQLVIEAKPTGETIFGYTSEDRIWGETHANSKESYVVKIYSDNTFMGQSSLKNINNIIDGDLAPTWNVKLNPTNGDNEYWTTTWDIAPSMDCQPTHVALEVDGVEVSRTAIQLNGPDNINKIYAAVTDADGKILSYATSLESAFNKVADGGRIELLRDVELSKSISFTKDIAFTLDGNGYTVKPAKSSTEANSAFNFGQGSDSTRATRKYNIENVVFEGWTTDHIVRLQGTTSVISNCTFRNNIQPDGLGLVTITFADVTVENCVFEDNTCVECIDVNSWGDGSASNSVIKNSVFNNNNVSGPAVVLYSDGASLTVKDNKFIINNVNTNGNAATLYMGFNGGVKVTGNLFEENTVTTTHATTKRIAGGIFAGFADDNCEITGNAFINNTATANGNVAASGIAYSAFYGAGNLDGNYWGGGEPVSGVDFTHEYPTTNDLTVEKYYDEYSVDADGNVILADLKPIVSKVVAVQYVENAEESDADKGLKVYDIVIVAKDEHIINRLNTADLTFVNSSDKIAYEIVAAEDITLTHNTDYPDRYMFNFNGKDNVADTDVALTIGQVRLTGYDAFTFKVAEAGTNLVTATTIDDNIVSYYAADGLALNVDVDGDGDYLGFIDTVIAVPVRDLAINIKFPNAVANQSKAYQEMKVVISGGDLKENIEIKLGSNPEATGLEIAGKVDAGCTVNYANNAYAINVIKALTLNNAYTVTVSGAGYRTARYTVTMTEAKTLNFWNNVMDNALEVEEGKSTSAVVKNFLAGDIVKDNNINIYDLSAVVSYFGTENAVATASDYAKYDLNRDGVIDSRDVAYVLVSWGE